MNQPQLIEFLRQGVCLCKYFTDERLEQLVTESRVVSYEPNEAVVEFGEDAAFLGVLLEGDLVVSVIGDGGQRQVLGKLTAGDTFGEMALMSGEKTLADIIAETRCQVLRIPVDLFQSLIHDRTGGGAAHFEDRCRPLPAGWLKTQPWLLPRFVKAKIPTACA